MVLVLFSDIYFFSFIYSHIFLVFFLTDFGWALLDILSYK